MDVYRSFPDNVVHIFRIFIITAKCKHDINLQRHAAEAARVISLKLTDRSSTYTQDWRLFCVIFGFITFADHFLHVYLHIIGRDTAIFIILSCAVLRVCCCIHIRQLRLTLFGWSMRWSIINWSTACSVCCSVLQNTSKTWSRNPDHGMVKCGKSVRSGAAYPVKPQNRWLTDW